MSEEAIVSLRVVSRPDGGGGKMSLRRNRCSLLRTFNQGRRFLLSPCPPLLLLTAGSTCINVARAIPRRARCNPRGEIRVDISRDESRVECTPLVSLRIEPLLPRWTRYQRGIYRLRSARFKGSVGGYARVTYEERLARYEIHSNSRRRAR